MKKILFLPKYSRSGASSRLRTFQYLPLFTNAGHMVRVSPFFNQQYLISLYAHKTPNPLNVLGCYIRRLWNISRFYKYDVIWIEKELFPYLPAWGEQLLKRMKVEFVVDYDDAVFHNYDKSRFSLIRRGMGDKIDNVISSASKVLVGNDYIFLRAKEAGASKVYKIPTSINISKYNYFANGIQPDGNKITIGWIGTPTTSKYLKTIMPALEELYQSIKFKLLLISGPQDIKYNGDIEILSWSEKEEVEQLNQLDIGIMPLPDNPFERGKCAYKLIQYMACGLPVVASPIGMNKDLVVHGVNGYLASNNEEWKMYLSKLIEDAALRNDMGKEGRKLVEAEYTLERNWEKLQKCLF